MKYNYVLPTKHRHSQRSHPAPSDKAAPLTIQEDADRGCPPSAVVGGGVLFANSQNRQYVAIWHNFKATTILHNLPFEGFFCYFLPDNRNYGVSESQ